ncbi:MAG TPA: alpha/beta fold hydrolase [Dehalococcoidia bacterium]|nr:alpha/beta fold hydrolase [Dehalococcoidia bacterium]
MPHTEVNGARLYYEEHGEGVPLVLSHGGWTDTSHWLPNAGQLSRRWRVVLWDRRGCGRSSDPGEGHTWQLWRDDLRGLLDHLGIDSAYAGGCSYGALLSLELALEWPRMVRALVLESGSPDGIAGAGPDVIQFPARAQALHRITVPTLIVQGELDPFWPPAVAERMQREIAGSELAVVAGAGHVPHLDDPALFNRTVEEFLLRVAGTA